MAERFVAFVALAIKVSAYNSDDEIGHVGTTGFD